MAPGLCQHQGGQQGQGSACSSVLGTPPMLCPAWCPSPAGSGSLVLPSRGSLGHLSPSPAPAGPWHRQLEPETLPWCAQAQCWVTSVLAARQINLRLHYRGAGSWSCFFWAEVDGERRLHTGTFLLKAPFLLTLVGIVQALLVCADHG